MARASRLHAIAALKARYNDFEHRELKFPKVKFGRDGPSEPKHKALKPEELDEVFKLAKQNPTIDALVHFLYDAGARIQDAEGLRIEPFLKEIDNSAAGGRAPRAIVVDLAKKKSSARKVPISSATIKAIATLLDGRRTGFVFERAPGESTTSRVLAQKLT